MSKNLYQTALHLFKENRIEEAAKTLEQLLSEDPSHSDGLEALGVVYGKLNRLDEAMELMRRLAKVNPDSVMAHANLSQFYMRKGMIQEAEHEQAQARLMSWKAELKAKKLSDSEIEKISLEEAGRFQQGIEEKIEKYKKVIEYDPNDVLGYFTLGTAYLQGKRFLEAMQTLQKAIQVNSGHSPSYVGLGEALEALGMKEDALELYKKGITVADKKGDIIPLRKMENRLRTLLKN